MLVHSPSLLFAPTDEAFAKLPSGTVDALLKNIHEIPIGTAMHLNNGFPTHFPFLQGLRILVVDNNIDCCDLMTLLLQPYGVEVRVAFLVQPALEIFVQWQPDVLVSEIALPKEDGYALIRQVRTLAAARGKEALAIAVTAYATEETQKRALSAEFDLWFTKPLNFDEFLAVLACLSICQRSSYAIAQRILGNVPRSGALSLEKQLELTWTS